MKQETFNPTSPEVLAGSIKVNILKAKNLLFKYKAVLESYKVHLEEVGDLGEYEGQLSRLDNQVDLIKEDIVAAEQAQDEGDIKSANELAKKALSKNKQLEVYLHFLALATEVKFDDVDEDAEEIAALEDSLNKPKAIQEQPSNIEAQTDVSETSPNVASVESAPGSESFTDSEKAKNLEEEVRKAFFDLQEMSEDLEKKGLLAEFRREFASAGFKSRKIKEFLDGIQSDNNKLTEEEINDGLKGVEADIALITSIGDQVRVRLNEYDKSNDEVNISEIVDSNIDIYEPEFNEEVQYANVQEAEKDYTPEKVANLAQLYKDNNELAFLNEQGRYKGLTRIKIDITNVLRSLPITKGEAEAFMSGGVGEFSNKIFELEQAKKEAKGKKDKYKIQAKINGVYGELLSSVSEFLNSETVKVKSEEGVETIDASNIDIFLNSAVSEAEELIGKIEANGAEESSAQKSAKRTIELIKNLREEDKNVLAQKQAKYLRGLLKTVELLRSEAETLPAPENKELESEVGIKDKESKPEAKVAVEALKIQDSPEYFEAKERLRSSSLNYKKLKESYEQGVESYYTNYRENSSLFRKGFDGVKKIFGSNPDLPESLVALQTEYKEIRSVYAKSLDEMIALRGKREINNGHTFDADNLKMAFGRKFILRPNKDLLAVQEKALTPEEMGRVRKVLALLGKHRMLARIGSVAIGTAIGVGTGGLGLVAAGALSAGRLAVSTTLSMGASTATNVLMQKRVNAAGEKLVTAENSAMKNFSLDDLEALETELVSAQSTKSTYERQQKAATIAAGAIVGGAAGYGIGSLAAAEVAANAAGDSGSLSAEAIARLNETAENVPTPDMAEALLVNNPTGIIEDGVGQEMFKVESVSAPYESVSGVSGVLKIGEIKLVGTGVLDVPNMEEVNKFLVQSVKDIVAPHANISEANIESQLLEKFNAKFGAEDWVKEAGVTKIDIAQLENFRNSEVLGVVGAEEYVVPDSAIQQVEVKPEGTYEVQKGDTLWDIIKEKNAEALNKLPVDEQNRVLDALFDKVRATPELSESLGLRSGNDIDLIYPDEKLNLSSLNEELNKIVEGNKDLGTYTKSSGLNVAADDAPKNVPINVVERPIIVGTEVGEIGGNTYTEAIPDKSGYSETPVAGGRAIEVPGENVYTEATPKVDIVPPQPEILKVPNTISPTGNPFELKGYQNYLTQKYGDMDTFNKFVNKQALSFEANTYGAFEKNAFFGTDYQSPYTMLSEMTIKDLDEFAKQPSSEIRTFLSGNDMKYETYLAWMDKINELRETKSSGLQIQPKTTIGSLFSQYVDKTNVPKVNSLTNPYVN
jgi:hypothetical protein